MPRVSGWEELVRALLEKFRAEDDELRSHHVKLKTLKKLRDVLFPLDC